MEKLRLLFLSRQHYDCGNGMETLKAAGIPSAILTAKHADGFCLWPSKYTDYCVKMPPGKAAKEMSFVSL